ncbi:hypothetical protein, partial [Pseudomonas syringae group genomosp. 3]|uniref:hypothetical protein n=3 Tax=Pseudomonas syringae group genomosp. 3 TaxID=251701 RepID=UPI0019313264
RKTSNYLIGRAFFEPQAMRASKIDAYFRPSLMAIIAAAVANYFYEPISEINKATLGLVSVVAAIPLAIGLARIALRGAAFKIDAKLQGNKCRQNVFGILLFMATFICLGTFLAVTR